MPVLKSKIPPFENLNGEQFRYLEGLDRRVPARTDLSASATLAQVITAINNLYADMRNAGSMERS